MIHPHDHLTQDREADVWLSLCVGISAYLFLTLKPLDKVNCPVMHSAPDDVLTVPKILFTSFLCHPMSRAKQVWEWVKFQSTKPFVVPEVNKLAAKSGTTKVNWDHFFKDKERESCKLRHSIRL